MQNRSFLQKSVYSSSEFGVVCHKSFIQYSQMAERTSLLENKLENKLNIWRFFLGGDNGYSSVLPSCNTAADIDQMEVLII